MIRFNDPDAIRAISEATTVPFVPTHHQCIARFDDAGNLLGGVLFTDYNVASIQIHVASFRHRWIDRELLWITMDYPFNKLGVKKLIGLVRESNKAAIDFDLHLGFTIEARIPDVFPDCGMVILGMYKSDARRYLEMRLPRLTFAGNTTRQRDGEEFTDT